MNNLRVFRQNSYRTIVIWDSIEGKIESLNIFKDGKPIVYDKFIPPENKFTKKTDGVIIPHKENDINPFETFTLKFEFLVNGKLTEITKDIYGLDIKNKKPENNELIVKLYVYDYKLKKWVPFPYKG